MKQKECSCNVMAIVHGKSEYVTCKSIFSNLRIKHEIISDKKGAKSIQVGSLKNVLKNSQFKDRISFRREYDKVQFDKNGPVNFRVFVIMDLDDCSIEEQENFKSGKMFSNHWLGNWITPIYNIPDLENTMDSVKIPILSKKDYAEIFQPNQGALNISDAAALKEKLKKCNCSNMSEFLSYGLSLV